MIFDKANYLIAIALVASLSACQGGNSNNSTQNGGISNTEALSVLSAGGLWLTTKDVESHRYLTSTSEESELSEISTKKGKIITRPVALGMNYNDCGADTEFFQQITKGSQLDALLTIDCFGTTDVSYELLEGKEGIQASYLCFNPGLFNLRDEITVVQIEKLAPDELTRDDYSTVNITEAPYNDLDNEPQGCVEFSEIKDFSRDTSDNIELVVKKPWNKDMMRMVFQVTPTFEAGGIYQFNDLAVKEMSFEHSDVNSQYIQNEERFNLETGTLTIEAFGEASGAGVFQFFDAEGAEISGDFTFDYPLPETEAVPTPDSGSEPVPE